MSVVYPRISGSIGGTPNYLGAFSWTEMPAASTALAGATAYITNIGDNGGSYWICDGLRWRPYASDGIVVQNRYDNDISPASASENVFQIQGIPAGVMQDGGIITVDFSLTKTVLTATSTVRFRLGTSSSVPASNTQLNSQAKPASGDTYIRGCFEFLRVSATEIRVLAAYQTTRYGSHATAGYGTNITVPDMDQNTNYLMMTHQNAASETITNQLFRVVIK